MKEIKEMFDHLINEDMPREQILDWASKRMRAEDRGELIYEPKNEENRIWDSIMFFLGIDTLVDEKGPYLYCVDDIIDYKNQLGI